MKPIVVQLAIEVLRNYIEQNPAQRNQVIADVLGVALPVEDPAPPVMTLDGDPPEGPGGPGVGKKP